MAKKVKNGIIKELSPEDRSFYYTREVQALFEIGKTKACAMMKNCRKELMDQGILAEDYPEGRVPKSHFNKRYAIDK